MPIAAAASEILGVGPTNVQRETCAATMGPKKKRGRPGLERPKSREETPKEGYDRTSVARDVALQKLRVRRTIFNCIFCRAAHPGTGGCIPQPKQIRA